MSSYPVQPCDKQDESGWINLNINRMMNLVEVNNVKMTHTTGNTWTVITSDSMNHTTDDAGTIITSDSGISRDHSK